MPDPIYTAENTHPAYQLRWSLAVFWKHSAPPPATWLEPLQAATEPDGVRILDHRMTQENVSQFVVSTKPHVAPAQLLRSVKGRLQYLVRKDVPKAFRRNYSITSLGATNQTAVEKYVSKQIEHHPMPDERVDAMLKPFQLIDEADDLGTTRRTSHGEFIYNLHLVAVHQARFAVIDEAYCRRTYEMLRAVAAKKGHRLSRIGLLVDHVHWTIGCGIQAAPLEVGLGYLNNLAYCHGMKAIYQYGFYAGTFGPYDMNAVRAEV